MTDRILDIADRPVRLHSRGRLLVIEAEDKSEVTVPYADLATVVISHPQVTYSQSVLAGLAEANVAFVACDARHMPVAMLLPLVGHTTQCERFAQQAAASLPTCKRLWQQIVRAKIRAQARALHDLRGDHQGLPDLRSHVRSGDPTNVEAQAGRRYWRALVGDDTFRRDRDAADANRFLNYGYAILRALVARARCAAGLHPGLGIHHHNRYDPFPLADDLMEPFRPVVDRAVVALCAARGPEAELDREAKAALIGALTARFHLAGEQRTLFDILGHVAASLVRVFGGEARELTLPEI